LINAAQDVIEKISRWQERKVYYDHSNASPADNYALFPVYSVKAYSVKLLGTWA
jgi:hypothetical protein